MATDYHYPVTMQALFSDLLSRVQTRIDWEGNALNGFGFGSEQQKAPLVRRGVLGIWCSAY